MGPHRHHDRARQRVPRGARACLLRGQGGTHGAGQGLARRSSQGEKEVAEKWPPPPPSHPIWRGGWRPLEALRDPRASAILYDCAVAFGGFSTTTAASSIGKAQNPRGGKTLTLSSSVAWQKSDAEG